MRTTEIKVYQFKELDKKAQNKALLQFSDVNTTEEWYDFIYENAESIGLKIESFDLDRNNHATGNFIEHAQHTANIIISKRETDTLAYKLAFAFLKRWADLVAKYSDQRQLDKVAEDNEDSFDMEADVLETYFLKDMLSVYANILQQQYNYLISDAAIIQTIKANEYEFTADGNQFLTH